MSMETTVGRATILIVEDEEDLREILQFNLQGEGYNIDSCGSAEAALERNLAKVDLVLLDVMLPGMSGMHLAQRIRGEMKLTMPIIFLTAKNTENDLLTGFNLGADDYITKPFSVNELIVRIRAVLKRTSLGEESTVTTRVGSITIDDESKRVFVDEKAVALTKKEMEILRLLISSPGVVYSRETILSRVWEPDTYVLPRTVDVHIARLRRKLGEAEGSRIVHRTGYGYLYDPEL